MRIQHRLLLLSVLAALLCAPSIMSPQSPGSAPGSFPEYVSFTGELNT